MEKPINNNLRLVIFAGVILFLIYYFVSADKTKEILSELSESTHYSLIEGKHVDGDVIKQGRLGKFYPCLKVKRSLHDKPLNGENKRYILKFSKDTYIQLITANATVYRYVVRDKKIVWIPLIAVITR